MPSPTDLTATPTPSASTTCSVTNSTTLPVQGGGDAQTGWNGAVVAINAYNSASGGTEQGYGQTLQLLPFASNGNTLPIGATDTITLDQTTVVNGKTIPVTLYDLIFAQSDNLFPVLAQTESLSFQPPYTYPAIPILPAASSATANALLFIKDINSFPTSTVANQFQKTVNGATTSATSSSGMEAAINAFFATTKDFQNVNFASYIAVSTYIYNFAFAWADFASSYTYYLYQSSGSTPSQGGGATQLGTVTFENGGSGVPSLTDANGGYTITYTDQNGNTTPLYFNSQQLVDEVGSASPKICLQMSYVELSQITGQSSDAATLVPAAFGNLNGTNAIGVFTEKPSDSGFLTSVENFFNSKGMQLVLQVLGLIMGIKMLCEGANWLKNQFKEQEVENGGNPVSPDQAGANRAQAENVENGMRDEQQAVNDRLGPNDEAEIPDNESDFEADDEADETEEEEEDVEEEAASEQEEIIEEEAELSAEAEVGVNPDMEQVSDDVRSEQSDLDNLDPDDLSASEATLKTDQGTMTSDQGTLDTVNEADEGSFSEEQKEQVEEDEDLQEAEQEEQQEEDDADDEAEEGDDVEDLDV